MEFILSSNVELLFVLFNKLLKSSLFFKFTFGEIETNSNFLSVVVKSEETEEIHMGGYPLR